MHLDFIIEGIQEQLEEFEKWWSTRTFPMPITRKDGSKTTAMIQIGLRERKAYSLIFPKEALGAIMNTLNPEDCVVSRHKTNWTDNFRGEKHKKGLKQFGPFLTMIRKFLKLKKLPKKDPKDGFLPMRQFNGIRVVGLGIREDEIDVTEKDGSTHEGL